VAAALVLVALPAAGFATSGAPATGTVYVVRSGRGAAPLRLTVRAEVAGAYGVVMSALLPHNRRASPYVTFTEFGVEAVPGGHDAAADYSTCGAVAASCAVTRTGSAVTIDLGSADAGDVVVVGVLGEHVRFTTTRGWSVTRTAGRVQAATGAATGTWAGTTPRDDTTVRAERFHAASATGGSAGSVAFSAIPCDVTGSGTALLEQDAAVRQHLDCTSLWSSIDTASRRATWSLTGDVVGATGVRTRLGVLDLVPRP
jgi:hypothetical protein